jgi:hypothetical protein
MFGVLGLLLKMRYGRSAPSMHVLWELLMAATIALCALLLPGYLVLVAPMVVVVMVFSLSQRHWREFASPPISMQRAKLGMVIWAASWSSFVGLVLLLTLQLQAVLVSLIASVLVVLAFAVTWCEPLRQVQRVAGRYGTLSGAPQYFVFDVRRRLRYPIRRVIVPFVLIPAGVAALTVVALYVWSVDYQLARLAVIGFVVGLAAQLMYGERDDLPGTSILRATKNRWWGIAPLTVMCLILLTATLMLLDGWFWIGAVAAVLVAALIGVYGNVVPEHDAPMHATVRRQRPTLVAEYLAYVSVVGVYLGIVVVSATVATA